MTFYIPKPREYQALQDAVNAMATLPAGTGFYLDRPSGTRCLAFECIDAGEMTEIMLHLGAHGYYEFARKLAARLRIEATEDSSKAIYVTFHGIPPWTEQQ